MHANFFLLLLHKFLNFDYVISNKPKTIKQIGFFTISFYSHQVKNNNGYSKVFKIQSQAGNQVYGISTPQSKLERKHPSMSEWRPSTMPKL